MAEDKPVLISVEMNTEVVPVGLYVGQMAQLEELAKKSGQSAHKIIRRLIDDYLEQKLEE